MAASLCFQWILLSTFCMYVTQAGLASTWDYCECEWDPWTPWSSCTATCGGGRQTRERAVWNLDIPECEGFGACASPGMGSESQDCNTICYNGGTYTSSWFSSCSCLKRYKGRCCEQEVTCGSPSTISHGRVVGDDYTYNHVITYICDNGYNMTDPTEATRTCTEYGVWSGTLPTCLYGISCSSNPCENNATCTNLLGDYSCSCPPGWTGKNCHIDIQPPIVQGCPDSVSVYVSSMTSTQTWTVPTFHDPHNFHVQVTTNYDNSTYEFPWGVFTVQYTAVKPSNGMSTECTFNISIKPYPCTKLTPAQNGILVCNGWNTDYDNVCKYYCNHGYQLDVSKTVDQFITCGATGHWLPVGGLQDCVIQTTFVDSVSTTFGNCSASHERERIADQYITDIKRSAFNTVCTNHVTECQHEQVAVSC